MTAGNGRCVERHRQAVLPVGEVDLPAVPARSAGQWWRPSKRLAAAV